MLRVFVVVILLFSNFILSAQIFQDVAPALNITTGYGTLGGSTGAGGISFCDFNGDGLDDLTLATNNGAAIRFFLNTNGTLNEIAPLIPNTEKVTQILWVDYDNDKDKDLFICVDGGTNKLYANDGSLNFTNVSAAANIPNAVNPTFGASFGDYDNDGWLDLYICNRSFYTIGGGENVMLHNNQDGTFSDVTTLLNVGNGINLTYVATFFDYNTDLLPDLLAVNDKVLGNMFMENVGGTFVDKSTSSNLLSPMDGMSTTIGDYDNDGDLDVYITNTPQNGDNYLFQNNNDGTFSDVSVFQSVNHNLTSWGANWIDYDNDMDLDLYVSSSQASHNAVNVLYENKLTSPFVPHHLNGDTTRTYASAIGDFNDDGQMDMVVCGNLGDPFIVWENTHSNSNNWLKVSLEGVQSNLDGIGAWIEVTTAGIKQYRYTHCGEGFLAQNSSNHHIGLDTFSLVNQIEIKWPSGVVDVVNNITVNQKIKVREGVGIVPQTCNNGVKDGDETGIDCGGTNCPVCDCNDYHHVINTTVNHPTDSIFRYRDYVQFIDPSDYILNNDIEIYAGDYIEILEGDITPTGNGSILLDIEGCIQKDFCYYTTLCNHEHFDINSLNDYSIARLWMEVLLESIRNDYARPTIHARNLFHASALMYEIWHIYNKSYNANGDHYLVNQNLNGFSCPMNFALNLQSVDADEAISYAVAKLLRHRFASSPAYFTTEQNINGLFNHFGYDPTYNGTNFSSGNPADLGNYIAECYINYGLQDGANEINEYTNNFYMPINGPLVTQYPGNPNITDVNRWQPLTLDVFIDQSGNELPITTPDFLSPEWGEVLPFAMDNSDMTTLSRDGLNFKVYKDPSEPPTFDPINTPAITDEYKWGFMMVSIWGAHLDKNNNYTLDISPASIGNNTNPWPSDFYGLPSFYNYFDGGDYPSGHLTNPATGQSYTPQIVKRGDYTRVLAEFWADGPDSETPPGHWFTLLNYVSDHPLHTKKFEGNGSIVSDLEWDVKSYFTLGGTMHDAAIAAWSVKGYYDYIRPVSAIRYMAAQGQSSDSNLPNYSVNGMPLVNNYVELVMPGDPLAGPNNEHLYKIKLYTWKGPDYINNPVVDEAGAGWILGENWWPYQRPSFVTPPFAGYVSGHSTFSRAAAEVLTKLTGDAFFPGGMGEFVAKKNEFLVFEQGPSQDIILQWATYRDASDQCSLSRIWGGIHPPVDDIPGRKMGEEIGIQGYNFSKNLIGL